MRTTRSDIDLSYKQNAVKVYYDIEVLPNLFTWMLLSKGLAQLVTCHTGMQGLNGIPSNEEFTQIIHDTLDSDIGRDVVGNSYDIKVDTFDLGNPDDRQKMSLFTRAFIECKPLCYNDYTSNDCFVEYYGWNSLRYDLPMLAMFDILLDKDSRASNDVNCATTGNLREVSNIIIGSDGPAWSLYKRIDTDTAQLISEYNIKSTMRRAAYADGHVDLAKLARSQDAGQEARFPPGLKKEMARYGLDIVIDELVAATDTRGLESSDIGQLVAYNINDVLGTAIVGRNSVITSSLLTRDMIRVMYPYTSAKSVPADKVTRWNPPERDCTAAELAGRVLIGPERVKPRDSKVIDYTFPLPDGRADLLEYMKEHEEFMPSDLYVFFDHFRGRDTTTSYQDYHLKKAQPITHSATLNVPYYRNGKPIDCYIRVSTGGAHGSVMAGLSKYSDEDVKTWTRSDAGAAPQQKPTVDLENVLHLDWSSFYPTMARKLELYKTSDGVDRYSSIIERRLEIKSTLSHDRTTWGEAEWDMHYEEDGLKFILNNATGAGNMHNKYALLPVDNKTLSMRLIGNMLIWCLGQRLAQAGAFIISTNTDGLYITGIDFDTCKQVTEKYVEDYGMPVDPEVIGRFINRDTSNRIEIENGQVSSIGGRLRGGNVLVYPDTAIGRNIAFPPIVTNAVVKYMLDKPDWLNTMYDREFMKQVFKELSEEATLTAWYHVHTGSSTRKLKLDDTVMDKVNRLVLTTDGCIPSTLMSRKLVKAQILDLIQYVMTHCNPEATVGGSIIKAWFESNDIENATPELLNDSYRLVSFTEDKRHKSEVNESNELQQFRDHEREPDLCRLGLQNIDTLEITELRAWSQSDSIAGYPNGCKVTALNSAKSLEEFNMDRLDVDAYIKWAEQLLASWKVTANIPAIGMALFNDTSLQKAAGTGRITKRDRAIHLLEQLYMSYVSS